jgi:hypothetical protein
MTDQTPPTVDDLITRKIQVARRMLAQLNFDAERSNERSALVLLALLGLTPDTVWADASNPRLRTVEIMEWLRTHYAKDYKPNTRETIRRRTLHQFADAVLIEQNPDEPNRPINSPKWCYQIHPRALGLLRSVGERAFEQKFHEYLIDVPAFARPTRGLVILSASQLPSQMAAQLRLVRAVRIGFSNRW